MFSVSDYKQAWLVEYPVNKNDYNFSAYSSTIHFSTYISYTIYEWMITSCPDLFSILSTIQWTGGLSFIWIYYFTYRDPDLP